MIVMASKPDGKRIAKKTTPTKTVQKDLHGM